MVKVELFNIRKIQQRMDLFNSFTDELNKGKPEREHEYSDSKLFDEALRLATKFLKYRKRKLAKLKKQKDELEVL